MINIALKVLVIFDSDSSLENKIIWQSKIAQTVKFSINPLISNILCHLQVFYYKFWTWTNISALPNRVAFKHFEYWYFNEMMYGCMLLSLNTSIK